VGRTLIKVDNKQDLDNELQSRKVLAIFYSTWCPFCNRFLPVFNSQMGNKKFENIVHVILDDNDNPLWDKYNVSAVPTIIYFENGKICDRLDARRGVGLNESLLTKWLQDFKY
jgi:thioredoxin 1